MPSPDFIVIGGMKSGTTSLYHYLGCHPDIAVSHRKEVNFFTRHLYRKKTIDWYEKQFPSGSRVAGDVSPVYSKLHLDPGIPERIRSALPHARLIYLVRDPVKRFVSHYQHILAKARTTLDPDTFVSEELNREGNVFLTGCYYKQLQGYLKFFPPEQILIVECEALRARTGRELARIFEFVGVSTDFVAEEFEQLHHLSSNKYMLNAIGQRLQAIAGTRRTLRLSRSRVGRRLLSRPMGAVSLQPQVRTALVDAYAPWNQLLREHTGLTLDHWSDAEHRQVESHDKLGMSAQ